MELASYIQQMKTSSYLAGCAVREEVPNMEAVDAAGFEGLLDTAGHHMLSAVVATALQAAGVNSTRVNEEVARGLWKTAQLEADWQRIRPQLEEAGIWYCPVKGAVVKDLYPSFGMRQMADYDVLFDASRSKDMRAIMEGLGFSCESFGRFHHDVYHKLPVSNFEMHRSLFTEGHGAELAHYYATVKDRLIKDADNNFGWHMSAEECYVYLLAHEYKHFASGGTGLRSVLDIYVYLRKYEASMNWDLIREQAGILGIADFEQQQRTFAQHLFGNAELTPDEENLFIYLATSGTYGTTAHSVANKLDKESNGIFGKLHYLATRVFLPMDAVKYGYPFFYRHKVLLPVLVVYRLGKSFSVSRKQVMREIKHVVRYRGKTKAD